jgi:hypothetical protein
MKTLVLWGYIVTSICFLGAYEVPPAWGDDLKLAGDTPRTEVFPIEKGTIRGDGNLGMMPSSDSPSYSSKDSGLKGFKYSSDPKILSERKKADAGFIVSNLVPVGTITKMFENKLGTTGPDEVYVDLNNRQGIQIGDRFTVYSLGRYIYHPVFPGQGGWKHKGYERRVGYGSKKLMSVPGKPVGYQVKILGVLEITEPGDKVSSARVFKAYDSIGTGDLLMPYQKPGGQDSMSSNADKSIEGYIIASKWDRIAVVDNDVIYIDKGSEDEVRAGDQFEVYSIPNVKENIWNKIEPQKTPLLPYVRGEIKVIATQKKTATAVVIKSRIDIEIGNRIRYKPSGHPG